MKKFTLLLFALSMGLFVSCSNDDDSTTPIDESLIPGTWSLTGISSENGSVTATADALPLPVSGSYTVSGKDITAQVTFTESSTEDPNTFTSSGGFTIEAEATFPTLDPITFEETIPDFIGSGEWRVEGNRLIISSEGEEQFFEISNLTAESITLKVPINETVEEQGFTLEITGIQVFTLTKN